MAPWYDCRVSVESGKCGFNSSCRTSWSRGEFEFIHNFIDQTRVQLIVGKSLLPPGWVLGFSISAFNKVSSVYLHCILSLLNFSFINYQLMCQWCMGNTILQRSHQATDNIEMDGFRRSHNFWHFITRICQPSI